MFRKILVLVLLLAGCLDGNAQFDSTSHLRISLLTCGPGDNEIWEAFGHTALRVIDSAEHTDLVFNYGTFDFGPDFEMQFMRGKLNYCLSVETFGGFMQEYITLKRKVEEQELLLDWKQKEHVYTFLQLNAEPEHRYYKYDFFFDNCATRIRDIFPRPEVFGKDFKYGQAIPADKSISFRDIINLYFSRDHWTRLGVNILLGSKIDKPMTNSDIMFLPDYLRDGIGGATVNGRKIATVPVTILPGNPLPAPGVNWALVLTCSLALLTIAGLSFKPLRILGKIMSALLLSATGLLGVLILVMWFATDHQGCSNNYNILWCLPLNLVIAFFNPKGKPRYALVAIFLILVSFVLSLAKVQGLIPEFIPLLLALLYIHGMIYRTSRIKESVKNA
jgi:uncharacterized protein DUF4105